MTSFLSHPSLFADGTHSFPPSKHLDFFPLLPFPFPRSTKSDKLSELKSLADAKGDVHNMHKLVYSDIQSPDVKRRILAHIKTQADIIKAHHDMRSRNKMQALGQYAWRKIISDVDDTLTCSGGANESLGLAGLDVSYPAKTVYPGVLAFYRELDLGTSGSGVWDDSKVPCVRAHFFEPTRCSAHLSLPPPIPQGRQPRVFVSAPARV